jgi:hypothetical protein
MNLEFALKVVPETCQPTVAGETGTPIDLRPPDLLPHTRLNFK